MDQKFFQWNVRGLRSKVTDFRDLVFRENPVAVCLQETKLSPDLTADNIGSYRLFRRDIVPAAVAHGGVAIAVRGDIPSFPFPLRTDLQAVAIVIQLYSFKLTVCSLFLDA